MEPRQASPENLPLQMAAPEQQPSDAFELSTPENVAGVGRSERTEQRLGHTIEAATQAIGAPSLAAVLPSPVVAAQVDDAAVQSDDTTPMVAADEDLIEKEWVDKAKKVISETKDDPFRREQEVKMLQIDYVKKRYGKAIGAPSDSDWET